MKTMGEVILFVSRQLSDQMPRREFTRWNRRDLLNYYNLGLKEIAVYKPEAFSTEKEIVLQTGSKQTVPANATLTSIIDPNTGISFNATDNTLYKAFTAYASCVDKLVSGQYKLRSFSIDKTNDKVFYVSPPVPPGLSPKVILTIQGEPTLYTFQDWNKEIGLESNYVNSLIDYMMARAYQMDTESQVSAANANRLFANFYNVMGVKYRLESTRGIAEAKQAVS